jgi:hypothetical protein
MTTKNSMEVTVSRSSLHSLNPYLPQLRHLRIGFRLLQTPSSTYAPSTIRNSAPLAEPRLGGAGASVPRCCLPIFPHLRHLWNTFSPFHQKISLRIGVSVDPCIPHSAFRLPHSRVWPPPASFTIQGPSQRSFSRPFRNSLFAIRHSPPSHQIPPSGAPQLITSLHLRTWRFTCSDIATQFWRFDVLTFLCYPPAVIRPSRWRPGPLIFPFIRGTARREYFSDAPLAARVPCTPIISVPIIPWEPPHVAATSPPRLSCPRPPRRRNVLCRKRRDSRRIPRLSDPRRRRPRRPGHRCRFADFP